MSIKHSLRLLNLTFAVILLILSSFFIIKLNDSMKGIEIIAFLEDNLDTAGIKEAKQSLEMLKGIKSIDFSNPDETVKKWTETAERKKLLALLDKNPFPPLFRLKLKKAGSLRKLRRTAESLENIPGIKAVEYGGVRTEEAIRRTKRYLFIFVFGFFAALINILDHIFIVKDTRSHRL